MQGLPRYHPSALYSCIIGLLLAVTLILVKCASGPTLETGEKAFQYKKYMRAAELFKKEYEQVEQAVNKANKAFRIAESYRAANKISKAEKWYERAVQHNYGPLAIYTHAQMLKQQEQYEAAIEKYKLYKKRAPSNKNKARRAIKGCRKAMKWKKNPSSITITPQQNVNTEASDYLPTFYGEDIVFSSQRPMATGESIYEWTGEKFSDLFIAEVKDGELHNVRLFNEKGKINTPYHEGATSFNNNYNELYFTRCGSPGKKDDYCRIYWSNKLANGQWEKPKPLPLFEDSTINVGQPSLGPHGQRLYFVADAPGGQGGKDLYVSTFRSGKWGPPKNLGPGINTSGDEMFPFFINDSTLYFSSDGYIGMGGLDIFWAHRKNGTWKVKNLRYPLNSGGDDFGITVKQRRQINQSGYFTGIGYFSSSRPRGKGSDDIYRFTLRKPLFFELDVIVRKKVFRKDTAGKEIQKEMPLPLAQVNLQHINQKGDTVQNKNYTSDSGWTQYDLFPQTDYQVIAKKEGYFTQEKEITTTTYKGSDKMRVNMKVELVLDTIVKEKELVIENIYYDYDKAKIRDDATPPLDTLAQLLRANPKLKVEIASHTDSRGNDEYNMKLSQRRSQSVVDYLVSKGVAADRLIPKGYGETKLLNECDDGVDCPEKKHQRNRRTTFKVVGIDREFESVSPEDIAVDSAQLTPPPASDTLSPSSTPTDTDTTTAPTPTPKDTIVKPKN